MRSRTVRALFAKDLRLHGRSIVLAFMGIASFLAVASWLKPARAATGIGSLAFSLNSVTALTMWGDWFISREKTKGTFAWLRTLPIDDEALVAEKFALQTSCCSVMWVVTSLLFARDDLRAWGFARWTLALIAIATFGALSLACRWRFAQKVGQVLPPAIMLVPLAASLAWQRSNPQGARTLAELFSGTYGPVALGLVALSIYCALFVGILSWVKRSDTQSLLE